MNGIVDLKLKVFREFQLANPTAHLGGSLGLMIRGVNVLRDLSRSDLDITVDEEEIFTKDLKKKGLLLQ